MYDLCSTTLCMICAPQRYVWSVLHNVMYDLCSTALCMMCSTTFRKKTVMVPKCCLWPWITNHILPPSVTNLSYCIAVTVI